MSARCDAAGNALVESEVELMLAVRWQGHGSLGFERTSTLLRDKYGDTVNDVLCSLLVDWYSISLTTRIGI